MIRTKMQDDFPDDISEVEQPCHVMDHQHVDCPLCKLNSTDPIIMKMNTMEESLSGKISSDEIYKTLYQFYKHQK